MGVKDLWTILAPVKKHQPIASLKGQTIAVDLSIWVCESITVKHMQGKVVKPHLRNLFFRVSNLLQLGIKLIFVIDGEAPELKWEEMSRRTQARYGAYGKGTKPQPKQTKKGGRSNFKVWLKECQEMLAYLGIPCVQSKGEAEAMCAVLNSQQVADACLTEDGDAFLYGADTVYRNFTLNTKDPHVDCYSMTDIRKELGLDRDKLIALALLLGCDYLPKGVVGVGKEQGCQLMKQLNDVSVLERFEKWANGEINADCLSQVSKPSHCRVCNHIGTGKQHKKQGCGMCATHIACKEQPKDVICYCTWHVAQSNTEITQVERDVMRKAMKTAGFPFKPVIREYLDKYEVCPSSPLCWKRPQLTPLQKFNLLKMDWPEDYTLDKVFPLITLYDLTSIGNGICKGKCLVLDSFVKTRTRQGVPCIEVRWQRPDWDGEDPDSQYYNTIEREDLLAAAYADKYKEYMQDKEAKKSSKSKGKRKQKADLEADTDLACSQQPSSAPDSTAVDDASVDALVDGVMSLDISKSAETTHRDTEHLDTGQTTGKMTTNSKNERTTSEKTHPKYRTTSEPVQGSQYSCDGDDTKAMRHLSTAPTRTITKQTSTKVQKSANSSDLEFLDELLEYEASKSLESPNEQKQTVDLIGMGTRYSAKSQVEEDTVEAEMLPLFQRLCLKSAKGTGRSRREKVSLSSSVSKQQNQHFMESKRIGEQEIGNVGRTVQSEGNVRKSKQGLPQKCEVIVIDSDDAQEEESLPDASPGDTRVDSKLESKTNGKNTTDISVQQNQENNFSSNAYQAVEGSSSLVTNLSKKESLKDVEKSLQMNVTTSTDCSPFFDINLTATGEYLLASFADDTAVADYKLIQQNVSEVIDDGKEMEDKSTVVTLLASLLMTQQLLITNLFSKM
ncbi:flap endonuclease GEN homolog 1-like [Amphiura filiformis]|uniref:flap endonuclease GEN homolog 1-like n=1 Tax=Amphiura filiformis TaxID=82378 RepID=UPI003B21C6FD